MDHLVEQHAHLWWTFLQHGVVDEAACKCLAHQETQLVQMISASTPGAGATVWARATARAKLRSRVMFAVAHKLRSHFHAAKERIPGPLRPLLWELTVRRSYLRELQQEQTFKEARGNRLACCFAGGWYQVLGCHSGRGREIRFHYIGLSIKRLLSNGLVGLWPWWSYVWSSIATVALLSVMDILFNGRNVQWAMGCLLCSGVLNCLATWKKILMGLLFVFLWYCLEPLQAAVTPRLPILALHLKHGYEHHLQQQPVASPERRALVKAVAAVAVSMYLGSVTFAATWLWRSVLSAQAWYLVEKWKPLLGM